MAVGLAVVAAVFVAGEIIATRTTRDALEAVRAVQQEQEPLASAANGILDRLMAYDRAVGEYVQAHEGVDKAAITRAGSRLEQAVTNYFASAPVSQHTARAMELRDELSEHIATARALADRATQRAQWAESRQAALNRVYQHIDAAGGAGVAVDGTQVFGRRSLVELESAINAVRGNSEKSPTIARREEEFRALLQLHAEDLALSPGRAWLWLVKQDFDEAVRLRVQMAREDQVSGPQWHALLEDSATLANDIQEQLQRPARAALFLAAERASTAAVAAEETRRASAAGVLGLLLLMSVLLILSISLPIRRLTAATRRLAGGDRSSRAPRGGAAEVDELASSFNAMADRIERAEASLRAQQAELERHVAERTRQLHHLAHHDPLTQLPNRRTLAARLTTALAAEGGRRLALLFVDVDNFKSINDTLGHSFGDRVLQQIAERLRAASGTQNLLARLGGDEFTLLLENVASVAEVEAHAARVVAALQEPLSVDGRVLNTSASVGASLYPDHAADAEGLLRAADVALFRAKELGRNRYALYSPELYDAAAQRFRLEQSLRRAVEKGELMLMYQPQVALDTFQANDVEALLRWSRPDGRIATASEFIQAAEKTGLIHELTHWILQTGITAAALWRAQGWSQSRVAINVSAPQFFESDFVGNVANALKAAGLPPSALELEITETVFQ
ncbi:MAG: diguanylate cyclase, partial [Gammaproteobacteria bacterium]|nr:diguanylate cyclase [Gammaproteobacteria bacterium]